MWVFDGGSTEDADILFNIKTLQMAIERYFTRQVAQCKLVNVLVFPFRALRSSSL